MNKTNVTDGVETQWMGEEAVATDTDVEIFFRVSTSENSIPSVDPFFFEYSFASSAEALRFYPRLPSAASVEHQSVPVHTLAVSSPSHGIRAAPEAP